jgi:hypothetical protein
VTDIETAAAPPRRARTVLVIAASLVAGFVGGVAGSAVHDGPQGPRGARGVVGPSGPSGEAANVDDLGVCWNLDTVFSNSGQYVRSADVSSPTLNGHTQSCPSGYFVRVKAIEQSAGD